MFGMFNGKIDDFIKIGVLVGMLFGAQQYFASASHVKMVELRLDQKILRDTRNAIRERLWQLEERNRADGRDHLKWKDARDRAEYQKLLNDLRDSELIMEKWKR